MNILKKRLKASIIISLSIILSLSGIIGHTGYNVQAQAKQEEHVLFEPGQTWIIKWIEQPDPAFIEMSEVIEEMKQFNAVVARPKDEIDAIAWVQAWQQSPYVSYIHMNQKVHISAIVPNDPLYNTQTYLQQIKAEEAWHVAKANTDITIAIVDTGVDMNHPDLQDNLVRGTNYVQPLRPPQDDNGHGTSLAGIIGAKGNNKSGITGLLWDARIMPIKALDKNGTGDEHKLGQGIRYAVDNGAKIVLLSLGLYKYSPFLEEVVQYAEEQGVLLIAATGNDGRDVKYPAAYPTVLAVGGVDHNNVVVKDSNFGPEVDIVAPWYVYTTTLDDERYGYNKGTSMAAPQAAAVAALVWAKYPHLKPYQIREHLRMTAEDLQQTGWDAQSGFGLLRADQALIQPYNEHAGTLIAERESAMILPINSIRKGYLSSSINSQWYSLETAYDGSVTLHITGLGEGVIQQLELIYYKDDSNKGQVFTDLTSPITLQVQKGYSHIQVKYASTVTSQSPLSFLVASDFLIYSDPFEENDRQYTAYVLPDGITSVVGTFHQVNDEDWFVLHVEQSGTLRVNVFPDTNRMDLELLVFKQGERITLANYYDNFGGGQTEYSRKLDVLPGKYFIRVKNVIAEEAYPVVGEYTLNIDYERKYIDPYEPNDRAFQATTAMLNHPYTGVISEDDVDWFTFSITEHSQVTVELTDIPLDRMMTMTLLTNTQQQLDKQTNSLGERLLKSEYFLAPGTYYVSLTANQSFEYQMYNLNITAKEVVAGLTDIKGHWAEAHIEKMIQAGIVNGYSNHRFYPDRSITRAEAVTIITNALNLTASNNTLVFSDVEADHWAFQNIALAVESGIVQGYPDGTFKPDQPTTRVEMAAMIANAMKLSTSRTSSAPFTDVSTTHWAADILAAMKKDGWIEGYEDGSYKPSRRATRAEFVTFIARVFKF